MRSTTEVNTTQEVYRASKSDSCQQAWKMTDTLVSGCRGAYSRYIVAIMLTGSLARGSYQPGLSDVNLITVLDDESPDNVRIGVSTLYHQISHGYNIQFEPIIINHHDFWPPWDNSQCIQPELLRLKASGKVLSGRNIIAELPTPTKREMWQFDLSFRERLIESKQPPWQHWTLKSSLKTILGEATSYFYYKTGIIEYSKHNIANLFSHHIPYFSHLPVLKLASYLWRRYPCSVDEELQIQMAKQARDFRNHVTLALGFGKKCLIR